ARVYGTLGLFTGGAAGLLLMAIGFLIGKGPIEGMVASAQGLADPQHLLAQQYAWSFLAMLFVGLGFMGAQFAAINVFNALGLTAFPMWLLVISNIANLVGNWVFIPGYSADQVRAGMTQYPIVAIFWPLAASSDWLRAALHIPALGVA